MGKGSGSRTFNKAGEESVRKNAFWDTCEFKLKKDEKEKAKK